MRDIDDVLLAAINDRTRKGTDAFALREWLITLRDIRALPEAGCNDFDWDGAQ